MTRRDFALLIAKLIVEMNEAGDRPIIHYGFRSRNEQFELYTEGKSKCDGTTKRSRHQDMLAVDLYLATDDGIIWEWPEDKAFKWHARFVELGGGAMISWDAPHFSSDGK